SVVAMSVAVIAARRRWPAALTVWLAYAALLLPVAGIVHNGYQIAADRYSYLACLTWVLLAGAFVTRSWDAARKGAMARRVGGLLTALSATIVLVLAALTPLQMRVWSGPETFWRHVLAVDPHSAFAHLHLAEALAAMGRRGEAHTEFERALEDMPD